MIAKAIIIVFLVSQLVVAEEQIRIIAFGDSITAGDFDDAPPSPTNKGYPPRLENSLGENSLNTKVLNHGAPGETTGGGLNRVEESLDEGNGDIFILMEGTNDISRGLSVETITFNLSRIGQKAEDRGLKVIIASVIPRRPEATVDSNNEVTRDLRDSIANLAQEKNWRFIDTFEGFIQTPNLFSEYYYQGNEDPVGHPNGRGYDLLTEILYPGVEEEVLNLLAPDYYIELTDPPAETGKTLSFSLKPAQYNNVEQIRWHFGENGVWVEKNNIVGKAIYTFLDPGVYTIRAVLTLKNGESITVTKELAVNGNPVEWYNSTSLIPFIISGPRGNSGIYSTDLMLYNPNDFGCLVELHYLARGHQNLSPITASIYIPNYKLVSIEDIPLWAWELEQALGTLQLVYICPQEGSKAYSLARTYVEDFSASEGTFGLFMQEIEEKTQETSEKLMYPLIKSDFFISSLLVANLSNNGGSVTVTLYDRYGNQVGNYTFNLGAKGNRLRRIDQIFPLDGYEGPYSAKLQSDSIKFTAAATVLQTVSQDQFIIYSYPLPSTNSSISQRIVRGPGLFEVTFRSDLFVKNLEMESKDTSIVFLRRGKNNLNEGITETINLAPHENFLAEDAVLNIFDREEDTGAVVVKDTVCIGGILAKAKKPQTTDNYIFASFIPFLDPDYISISYGEKAFIFGAEQNGIFYTSLGVINLAEYPTIIGITLKDAMGNPITNTYLTLKPLQHLERNLQGIFPTLLPGGPWIIEVNVIQGGPVAPYMAKINISGDILYSYFYKGGENE